MLKFTNLPASEAGYKTVQCRVKPKCIIAEGAYGAVFWATPARAKLLCDVGAIEIISGTETGPTHRPQVGPAETKPAGAAERKAPAEPEVKADEDPNASSAGAQGGQSTDSAVSADVASAEPSSASEVAPASPASNVSRSRRGGRRAGAGKSSE